jgi:alpha-1,6-mannosyltransferase
MDNIKEFLSKYAVRITFSLGIILEGLFLFYLKVNLAGKNIPAYMVCYGGAFLVFLAAVLIIKNKKHAPERKTDDWYAKYKTPALIIFFGLLFRATLIPSDITTSDDVYRYIWEGKVLYNGFNPYQHPPGDPALIPLYSKDLPAKVTFHNFAAIYPPLSQMIFVVNYVFSGEKDTALKFIFLLCEAVTLIFITLLLKERKKDLNLVILYAWLPLPIMEYFVNSHVDPLGIMFFVMFLYFTERNKLIPSAVVFTLSFLSKLYPVFLLPLILKKYGFKKSIIFGLIFAGMTIAFFLPFVPKDRFVAESLIKYLTNWQFNSSFYYIFLNILHNGYQAKIICNIFLIITVLGISYYYKDFLRAVTFVLLAVIAFTATIYPWYLGWIAALNPLFGLYSLLSFYFTINFSNLTPLSVGWKEYWQVTLIEYVPFYLLLFYDIKKIRSKSGV